MGTTPQKKVLIADDNSRLLKLLELRFSQTGYLVYTAEKIKDAVVTAIIIRPDLIITDVMMSEINGWEFKKLLGKIPNMTEIPFIFLTSTDTLPDEFYSQDFGISDYIQKPYSFEDLLQKVEKNLRRHHQMQQTFSPETPVPSGTLNDMSPSDILQVLAMNKRNCVVKLSSGGKHGEIFFKRGRVYAAKTGNLEGEEAVYELLSWQGANFLVGESVQGVEETVSKDIYSLIAEGMKRKEEKKNQWASSPSTSSVEQTPTGIPYNGGGEDVLGFLTQLQKKGLLKELSE